MTQATEPVGVVAVAVDTPQHARLGSVLDYEARQLPPVGALVRVPLGRREVVGIVWPTAASRRDPALPLRPISAVLDALPPLSSAWLRLVEFAAGYYQRSVGELALSVLPPELRRIDDTQLARRLRRWSRPPGSGGQAAGAVPVPPPDLPALEAGQESALQGFAAAGPRAALLHGVTGSGKTEVYLRAAAHALAHGRQVLVMVPEINLTPQLQARFMARFPGRRVVSLHSALTSARRLRHWVEAHLGQAELVLGTRLAVFASLPRLGLIVVDEEHDPSFKQQEGARYSARDLAVWRGHHEQLPVMLGSATPSLESWQRCGDGHYLSLALPRRVGGAAMPVVRIADMRVLPREPGRETVLAPALQEALRQRMDCGEQSLLLLNRRGWAPVLHCGACGWKSACPHCSAWRVFHKSDRTLRCHHCSFAEAVPRACPDCGNLDIAPIGRGTEKLEEQVAALLPGARVARIDADSTRRVGSLEAQLAAVHAGEVDILVGTQMVAKGHDFRRMTLVAAVNPDGALFSADFRAPERLFALLMQAAGRAGRDADRAAAGEMWIQTWHPDHPLYAALARHDYPGFAASQLDERRRAGLPPFSRLALLRAEAREVDTATRFLQEARQAATGLASAGAVTIYAPVPPGVARVAGIERMQMLVESRSRPALQAFLTDWLPMLHERKALHKGLARWAIDVDPAAI